MHPNISIQKLTAFKEVAERNSITEAARTLGVSQPVVSVHVRDVEQYFGGKLLHQEGRQMVLTEAGALVYEHVKTMLSSLEGAQDDVRSLDSGHAGSVVIGSTDTPGSYRLPSRLIDFQRAHSKAQVALSIGVAWDIWVGTRNGVFDFAVVAGPAPPHDLQVTTYSEERLVMVCAPDHPLAGATVDKADLRDQHLVTASRRTRTDDRLHAFGLENSPVAIQLGSTEGIKQAVQQRLGIAVLFACSVERELESGSLTPVHVRGVDERRPFYLIAHARKRYSPVQQQLVDFLLSRSSASGSPAESVANNRPSDPHRSHRVRAPGAAPSGTGRRSAAVRA